MQRFLRTREIQQMNPGYAFWRNALIICALSIFSVSGISAHEGHDHSGHDHDHGSHTEEHVITDQQAIPGLKKPAQDAHAGCGAHGHETEEVAHDKGFDPVTMIMHHIADAHDWHILDLTNEDGSIHPVSIPLPIILYTEGHLDMFMSSAFHHGETTVVKGDREYCLSHGHITEVGGKHVMDFSITKNVTAMFISVLILVLIFAAAARGYDAQGKPSGIGAFLEPLVLFVRDEIAIPNIGEKKYARFMPYLLTAFFFIWINNLLGLVPFFPGGANLTGNIAFTLTLSVFTLILTNLNGTKDYWGHIFWMPGVPVPVKLLLAPIEVISIFTKPFALMMRLFANITAGHILILSLVSLIFLMESVGMSLVSVPFMIFMNCLELLVAALQAYIFTLLSALFIGLAVEEHDHAEAH